MDENLMRAARAKVAALMVKAANPAAAPSTSPSTASQLGEGLAIAGLGGMALGAGHLRARGRGWGAVASPIISLAGRLGGPGLARRAETPAKHIGLFFAGDRRKSKMEEYIRRSFGMRRPFDAGDAGKLGIGAFAAGLPIGSAGHDIDAANARIGSLEAQLATSRASQASQASQAPQAPQATARQATRQALVSRARDNAAALLDRIRSARKSQSDQAG